MSMMLSRAAKGSVGPSTARSMGPKGTIAAAKGFLLDFDVRSIKASTQKAFLKRLDAATEELKASLPKIRLRSLMVNAL
jgi:hypothetical protein